MKNNIIPDHNGLPDCRGGDECKINISTTPPNMPIEFKKGERSDYLNYKNADHIVDGHEAVKRDVFNRAVEECWCAMRMMCVDRIPTEAKSKCKQGGMCDFQTCPEMSTMRIRLTLQE